MYLSEQKPSPIDMVTEDNSAAAATTTTTTTTIEHHNQVIIGDNNNSNSSGGEEQDMRALPKKRAETWTQEETRSLISLRREIDGFFNTSKSNKHLWDQISSKMRERGFDRSPTMCTDKWRNLLKEFKKVKHHHYHSGGAANKMLYYKELEELLRSRPKNVVNGAAYKSPAGPPKVDSFVQFSDKGVDDCSIPYGLVEAGGRSTVNLERPLDNDGDPLAITTAEAVVASGVPPWNWRESPANGAEGQSAYVGRVITVKWGEYTRRIGIDATTDAIKEAIKSVFGLRTNRAFWLEDDDNIIRPLDRDMPLGNYTLHLDEGVSIKIFYDESDPMPVRTEDKNMYTEEDFRSFLARRGLIGLRELNGYRCCFNVDELRPGAVYQAVRLLSD